MRVFLFLILLLCSCSGTIQLATSREEPRVEIRQLPPGPKHILLLNTFNTRNRKFRENKKELFDRFIDSVLTTAATLIMSRPFIATSVVPGFTDISSKDSLLYNLMIKQNATYAMVIDSFNVDFNQTRVEVTKTSSGSKDREAFYDIVSTLSFSLYNKDSLIDNQLVNSNRYHSSRKVVSGLLAAGPNVVIQRKDAWEVTERNLRNYLTNVLKMFKE